MLDDKSVEIMLSGVDMDCAGSGEEAASCDAAGYLEGKKLG